MLTRAITSTTACLAAMSFVVGCTGAAPRRGRVLLAESQNSLVRRDYKDTIEKTDRFLREFGSTREAGRAYYLRGKAKLSLSNVTEAKSDLQEAVNRSPNADVRANSRLALGQLAFDNGRMVLAEELYRDAIADIEVGKPPGDHARYRLGCVLQRRGLWSQAELEFRQVVEYFANTELARRSSRRVNATAWTVQAGAFGSQSRAALLVRKLRSVGFAPDIKHVLGKSGPLFVVVVNRYETHKQAAMALRSVKRQQADAFVTVR
ncbi:MAG: SPOR domain-containing protein [Phycisphaerae bacterium]|nr:SPOR domain-containing protein [Phycisphaerae bacterium]